MLAAIVDATVALDRLWKGETAMSLAIKCGNVSGAYMLVQAGADPNQMLANGRTALQAVCVRRNENLCVPPPPPPPPGIGACGSSRCGCGQSADAPPAVTAGSSKAPGWRW